MLMRAYIFAIALYCAIPVLSAQTAIEQSQVAEWGHVIPNLGTVVGAVGFALYAQKHMITVLTTDFKKALDNNTEALASIAKTLHAQETDLKAVKSELSELRQELKPNNTKIQ